MQLQTRRKRAAPLDAAFNTWLERGLHELNDHVALELVPAELLRLIKTHGEK